MKGGSMMTRRRGLAALALLLSALCAQARAQSPAAAPAPSGHWAGSIEGPAIGVEIDLAREGADGWRGTISVPVQGTKGIPLSDLAVKDETVSFAIKGGPGDPRFSGALAADGKTITGTFSQGGTSLPLVLTWKGEPQFEAPMKNAAVSAALVGSWEGTLDVKGTMLRLVLTLANGPEGATGKLVSLDQSNFEMPVARIAEAGTRLTLTVPMVSGGFEGEVKSGKIPGTWTQGPLSLPLVFKKRP
jgi:hypothetical protein